MCASKSIHVRIRLECMSAHVMMDPPVITVSWSNNNMFQLDPLCTQTLHHCRPHRHTHFAHTHHRPTHTHKFVNTCTQTHTYTLNSDTQCCNLSRTSCFWDTVTIGLKEQRRNMYCEVSCINTKNLLFHCLNIRSPLQKR